MPRRLQYDDYGWLAVGAVVLIVEAYAPPGQMLSHGAARYKAARPVLTTIVIGYLAGHLLGLVPPYVDPLSRVAKAIGR